MTTPRLPSRRSVEERNALVLANLGLAYKAAYSCKACFGFVAVPLDDLIQEAILGLIRAAEIYDPAKAKFSTYATYACRRAVQRCLAAQQLIRVPALSEREPRACHLEGIALNRNLQSLDQALAIADRAASCTVEQAEKTDQLRQAIEVLPPRYQRVLALRMRGETLRFIGREMKLSRERIRQIQQKALKRLRKQLKGDR